MKRIAILFLFLSLFVSANLLAEVDALKPILKDTIRDEAIVLPPTLISNADALLSNWLTTSYLKLDNNCIQQSENPYFSDSVYIERLSKLPTVMEMPYNQIVRSYINLYAQRLRERVSYMMGLGHFYFPLFEQALDAENMPLELKYIPVIESALNPSAVSKAGAAGLWQFMLPTARQYGLEINSLIDERRDPVKSTQVAVKYFKELYRIYGDWGLVIAAYNCGPGNVNKAIRRAGGKKGYWDIYFHLPRETRGYLPAFIAVNYLMNYTTEHNICEAKCRIPMNTDTVQVNQMFHFQQIADVLNVPIEEIRMLNPAYRRDIIPGNLKPCTLRLPMFKAYAFIESQDTIARYHASELLLNFRKTLDPGTPDDNLAQNILRHKVKRGESILAIARKYKVSVSDIKSWNNLHSSRLPKGKIIEIIREKKPTINIRNSESLALHAKSKAVDTTKVASDTTAVATNVAQEKTTKTKSFGSLRNFSYHTVRSGDTLWSIANRYPGISVKDLMSVNRLRRQNAIQVGMKIKIPKT